MTGPETGLPPEAGLPAEPPPETTSVGRSLHISWLGRRAYGPTFEAQEEVRRRIKAGEGPERLLLLEHHPVFTLGRNADEGDVLADRRWLETRGVEVFESNRGGQVTYHGPGQLVGYPIVNLNPDRRDIGKYVRDLQETLLRALSDFGIAAQRKEGKDFIGIWVGDQKIASIGVHLSRWITIHGFALNVRTELEHFSGIVACGLQGVRMTSMAEWIPDPPALPELATVVSKHFADVFQRRPIEVSASSFDEALGLKEG